MLKSLLPHACWEHIFGPWRGKKVALHRAGGNVGDELILAGCLQLFETYGITQTDIPNADCVMYLGGGNMGCLYPETQRQRATLAECSRQRSIPFIILPQTWYSVDSENFTQAFARERTSQQFCPSAVLAPDLALAYVPDFEMPLLSITDGRLFFRADVEALRPSGFSSGIDPASVCSTPREYIERAARCGTEIHTNRMHFAVAALIAGRSVTLYANSYHKNRSMWETWLKDLGCKWGE